MFKNIKDKRAFEKIVDQIKDALLKGELKEGDKLPSENEMVYLFGVSRHVVREALRILELSGLVIIRHGNRGGAFVQKVSSNQKLGEYFSDHLRLGNIDLAQLTEARYWIESIIIDIAGKKGNKKDFEILKNSIDKAEKLFGEGKMDEKIYENFYFHILLAKISKNSILIDNISSIFELMSYILVKIKPSRKITENTFKAHREILKFLISGDLEKAKEINREHINDVSDRLVKKYFKETNPPYLKLQTFGKLEEHRNIFKEYLEPQIP
jgi:GntR family transcriptional repressor for pyruvate dehydrogenase complex